MATDPGRTVEGAGIPAGSFVGPVTDTPVTATQPARNAPAPSGIAVTGSFTLVNAQRQPVETTGTVSGITLGARTAETDPLYDYGDPTTGGGDTGSVLISPYITPGTVSARYYNHYSWLRTMEDLFEVGGTSPGLDGQGHLGYAAQPGLAPFGSDVFDNPNGPASDTPTPPAVPPATPAPTKTPAPTPAPVPVRVFHTVGKQPKPAHHHKKKHAKKHHKKHDKKRHHHHKGGKGSGHK